MVKTLCAGLFGVFLAALAVAPRLGAQQPTTEVPDLRPGNQLTLPADFREWVFLSAGLGMTYGPNAPAAGQPQSFTNVYVNPAAYRAFLKSGAWPNRKCHPRDSRVGVPKVQSIGLDGSRRDCAQWK